MDRRTIEIDFDIHKLIEGEKKSFSESDNVALRRLLKLSVLAAAASLPATKGREWRDEGVTFPHGTEVRMTYNKRLHIGAIEDGQWLVEGVRYSSPSAAAGGVALTKKGEKTNLDGWKYWEAKLPGSIKWKPINKMRWV
ncbi:MAG: hypothetical protein JWQ19_4015 [Subtercola sp.]|nr:hypothetical protein [Subtercola sp.]